MSPPQRGDGDDGGEGGLTSDGAAPDTGATLVDTGESEVPVVASILLVDDHPPNLVALRAILEPLGQPLVTAASGEEALRKLLHDEFAVILLDVQLPGLDGFQTAALIRGRKRSRHVPILFLTALNRDASHVVQGYSHGAVDYLLKPFDPDVLRAKVAYFVGLYVRERRLLRDEARLRRREREAHERRSADRLQRLTESMPNCVWAMGPDGAVYYSNRVWREYAGSAVTVPEAIHPDDRARVEAAWAEALNAGRAYESQHRLRRASDGAFRWHLVRAVPQVEGGVLVGWVATATDIDDRKRAEEVVERANRAKDEFLSTVSHELRTPLTAILGWTQMLRTGSLEPSRRDHALRTIERNAHAQARLIEDLLDISRITTGNLLLETAPVDLARVVEAALDAVRLAAEAKGIQLVAALEPNVGALLGDAGRLQQVVWNLLNNAIKFTPPDGHVRVTLARGKDCVRIAVTDDGLGIEPAFLPYVFERFRQADAGVSRMHGGLGLGLSIARHLVELHGGTIDVRSEGTGRGATFEIVLPRRASVSVAPPARTISTTPPPPVDSVPTLAGTRVLVVDDEADTRDLLAVVLEESGAAVTCAASVAEAWAALATQLPDVIVSDIAMPGEDGYALIRRIRALPATAGGSTPALALTAFARHEDRARAHDAGFDRHATKPIDPRRLVAAVHALATSTGT